jgi:VIT1/CCC1 family predicted Fe2+/Mn2+ transporter
LGTITATVFGFSILFVIGIYLGRLVKEIGIYSGLRFVLVGLATAAIVILLGQA